MKDIVVITRNEPYIVPVYLDKLLVEHRSRIARVYVDSTPSPHLSHSALFELCGPVPFLKKSLQYILYKIFGKTSLRRSNGCFYSISSLSKYNNIELARLPPFLSLEKDISELSPNILLSVANSKIIPNSILSKCKYSLNVHGSLLPKYRGVLSAFWALYNGEKNTGVTIHKMIDSVDSGDIYGQSEIDIASNATVMDLYYSIALAGRELISDTVTNIDSIVPRSMGRKGSEIFHSPNKEQRLEFIRRGLRFV